MHNFLNMHPNLRKCKYCEIFNVFCPVVCLGPVKWISCFHTPLFMHIITTRQTIVKKKKLYSYTFYVPFTIRGQESFLKPTVWISPSLLYTGYWVLCDQVIKAAHSATSSAKVKNEWRCTFTPLPDFMLCTATIFALSTDKFQFSFESEYFLLCNWAAHICLQCLNVLPVRTPACYTQLNN